MTKFYTETGDDGYTGVLGEGRPPKYDHRIEALGIIDEANASIGLARSLCSAPGTSIILLTTQKDLYHMMAEIAATPDNAPKFRKLTRENVDWLERQIEKISGQITLPNEFIIPGDTKAGAAIDLARTVVRRAERQVAFLQHQQWIENPDLLRYLNRLSSLCYALEIWENHFLGMKPTIAKE